MTSLTYQKSVHSQRSMAALVVLTLLMVAFVGAYAPSQEHARFPVFLGVLWSALTASVGKVLARRVRRAEEFSLWFAAVGLSVLSLNLAAQGTVSGAVLGIHLVAMLWIPVLLSVASFSGTLILSLAQLLHLSLSGMDAVFDTTTWILFLLGVFLGIGANWRKGTHQQSVSPEDTAVYQMWYRQVSEKAVSQAWQCVSLQAAILLILLFADLLRPSTEVMPIQIKLLGLASLIVSAYLLINTSRESVGYRMTLSTLLVGTVISLSTLFGEDHYSFYAVLPTLYLLALTSAFYWLPQQQMLLVGWLALIDVTLRLLSSLTTQNRAAIVLLCLGGSAAILLGHLRLQMHRRIPLAQNLPIDTQTSYRIEKPLYQDYLSFQLATLAVWQATYACLAIIVSVYTLAHYALDWSPLVLCGAIILFLMHLAFLRILRHRTLLPYAWVLAFATLCLTTLWGALPLLLFNDRGLFLFFWPMVLIFGLALSPWRIHELASAVMLLGVLAVEGAVRGLFTSDLLILLLISLVAVFVVSRRQEFLLREVFMAREGYKKLTESESTEATELRLLELLMTYLRAQRCILASPSRMCVMLHGDYVHQLQSTAAPCLQSFRDSTRATHVRSENIDVRFGSLREVALQHADERIPREYQEYGLLIDLEVSLRHGGSQVSSILLIRSYPFFSFEVERILPVLTSLVRTASTCIVRFLEKERSIAQEEELEELDRAREYELSAMVHDINNTVQDLTLLCEAIRDEWSTDTPTKSVSDVVHDLNTIEATARSIAHIVSDAKRRRELEQLDDLQPREVVDVRELVQDVAAFAILRAERKGISVFVADMPSQACLVKVSVREHLEAVLRNILQNALDYSSSGGTIRISVTRSDERVGISVQDDGIGLTSAEIATIFHRGVRGRARDHNKGGLGLGLAQSQRVIHAAGGAITASSEGPGLGSEFVVSLPQLAVTSMNQHAAWALLVDDESRLTQYYARLVTACGLKPEVAHSLAEVQHLLTSLTRPALVVTDLNLGTDSGVDVIEAVRRQHGYQLPILVVTGVRDTDRTNAARVAGASDVVFKPIGQQALYARIQGMLPQTRLTKTPTQIEVEKGEVQ